MPPAEPWAAKVRARWRVASSPVDLPYERQVDAVIHHWTPREAVEKRVHLFPHDDLPQSSGRRHCKQPAAGGPGMPVPSDMAATPRDAYNARNAVGLNMTAPRESQKKLCIPAWIETSSMCVVCSNSCRPWCPFGRTMQGRDNTLLECLPVACR
jgi:hypothetical protein